MDKVLLLIEPNIEQAKIFEDWLKEIGYRVVTAYNKDEAFSKIKLNPSLYHISILDADFPHGISEGLDLCFRLKNDEITKVVPLVLLTYKGRLDEIIAGLDAGADMFLLKPFEVDYFSERIKLIIKDMELKKHMKGVIDLALIEFLISLKEEGPSKRFMLALFKGFNIAIWNKIMPIMDFTPLQVTLESAKKHIKEEYKFIRYLSANKDGITINGLPSDIMNTPKDRIVIGFIKFMYNFLDIITTLSGNIVVDMDVVKKWSLGVGEFRS